MAALGKLVAGVMHELNSPIGAINSAADTALRAVENIAEAVTASRSIDELRKNRNFEQSLKALRNSGPVTASASDRINRVVESFRSFVGLDEAKVRKLDLRTCIEKSLTLLEHDLGQRIKVVIEDTREVREVTGNAADLNQVFLNLLANAAQSIEGEGTITVRMFSREDQVCVQISDSGCGISIERQQGIFEPHFSSKGERVKAGLGLFASRQIVENHQGEIELESGLAQGSTFTVSLPVQESHACPEPVIESPPKHRCERKE
jgi:signal transduction histidine kinase